MTQAQATDTVYQGRFIGATHRFSLRIYFEDTDAGGVVYHANYLRFMERARTDMLRCVGIEQRADLEAAGDARGVYVVSKLAIDYRRPAHLDDVVTVVSTVEAVTAASCTMRQRIERDGTVLTDASVVAAYVGKGGRPKRQPVSWRQQFEALADAARNS